MNAEYKLEELQQMSGTNLNTHAIEQFQAALTSATSSQKTEVRMTVKQAQALNDSLSQLLLRYTNVQEEIIKLQKELIEAKKVTVELKGDGF